MTSIILNFIAFQANWFANVVGAAQGLPWLGPVFLLGWAAAHFSLLRERAKPDWKLLAAAGVLGWLADALLVSLGLTAYPDHAQLGGPAPIWMTCLWLGFALTLRHSLRYLDGRFVLGALLGAVGGALAFKGGEALGAIALPETTSLYAVALEFAVITPLLLFVARSVQPETAPRGAPST